MMFCQGSSPGPHTFWRQCLLLSPGEPQGLCCPGIEAEDSTEQLRSWQPRRFTPPPRFRQPDGRRILHGIPLWMPQCHSLWAMLTTKVSVPLRLLNSRFPGLWNTLHTLSADNVRLFRSCSPVSPAANTVYSLSSSVPKTYTANSKSKRFSFKLPVPKAPPPTWWHHHSSVITVLYLSDIQHRYHDNRKRTVQSQIYLHPPIYHPSWPHSYLSL